MAKRLFLLLFSGFVGIFGSPEILMASDDFSLTGLNDANIVETVEILDNSDEADDLSNELPNEPVYVAPAQQVVQNPMYVAPKNFIQIAGRNLEIVDVPDTTVNAGDHVNKYGDRFLYGHNTANVFGGIVNLGIGDTFSVVYNGATINYRVAKTVIYEKNTSNGLLQKDGAGSYMRLVADAKSDGVQYGLSLMTCYGVSYGNGDASHRFVIFADAI